MMGATLLGSPDNKGLNGTKKTITDFFGKSPQNSPTIENKPKGLLGYFSKPSFGKNNNLVEDCTELEISPKSHKEATSVKNPANSKTKKRKLNGKQEISKDDNVKSKRQKSDKDIDSSQKDSSPRIKDKNPSSKTSILENGNHSGDNSKENAVTDVQEANDKKSQGKSVRRSLAKPKCPDGKKQFYEWNAPPEFSESGDNPVDDLSSGLCKDVDSMDCSEDADPAHALELSYEEYLLSQEGDPEAENLDETVHAEDELEDTNPVSPCPKATKPGSIATFFSQVHKPSKKENPDSQRVTVMADIHPEPRQKPPSPEKKPAGSKPGKMVLKTISLDAKSKLEELDSIVILNTEPPPDLKEVQTLDKTKQKALKKGSGSKKSTGKNKDSAPDVKDGKSSQSQLNFGGHKPVVSKLQDETTAVQNTNSSQSTLTFSKDKKKCQSEVPLEKPEDDTDTILAVKETVDKKTPVKRMRGRPKKKSTIKSKENIKEVKPDDQDGMKESQIAEKGPIVDANVGIPISKEEESNSDKISSDKPEKNEG